MTKQSVRLDKVERPEFQNKPPFMPLLLVEFRNRLNDEIMTEINEMIIANNTPDDP